MNEFTVNVSKLTDESLMKRSCEMTFLGTSRQSLSSMYKSEHSPCRTQLFWIECLGIPLFVSTHLIRHHVGSQPYQLTCRDDRNGGNSGLVGRIDVVKTMINRITSPDCTIHQDFTMHTKQEVQHMLMAELEDIQNSTDRNTPVNLGLLVNAQGLIDMAKQRECMQAHEQTRIVFSEIKKAVHEVDPDLANMMVKKCIYRCGICGEPKCCGYNLTKSFNRELEQYRSNFTQTQKGSAMPSE